jgi:hypothetical protein
MNQKLSAAVYAVTPPILWNAYLRMRGFTQRHPWRQFSFMVTSANTAPLYEGRFAEIYDKYQTLDPHVARDSTRYLNYNICYFGSLCKDIRGDIAGAGISWGVAARVLFEYLDLPRLGKTLHLIDPFDGSVERTSTRRSQLYNTDAEYVRRQYPPDASVIIHRQPIPIQLPGRIAFMFMNTGDPRADAASLPSFYESLSHGGMIVMNQYANYPVHYQPVMQRLNVTPLWLPSGQGVMVKT